MDLKLQILESEKWFGGAVEDGIKMPLDHNSNYEIDLTINQTYNQAVSFFISSKGRYIISEKGFKIIFKKGYIYAEGETAIILGETQKGLKEAFFAVSRNFPQMEFFPDKRIFSTPQYCTWIELLYNQNQYDIIAYAEGIIKKGFPPGILIIDDNWQEDYGIWEFKPKKFPNPKKMIKHLHDLGFTVMLWVAPFVSPDSKQFRDNINLFIKDSDGKIAIREWWNGYSALLDLSNPDSLKWLENSLNILVQKYGIDGFKFDGGDAQFYKINDKYFKNSSPNDQSFLWSKFATKYPLNELRCGFNAGGLPIINRLCDKFHSWGLVNGLKSLIPCAIAAGLGGYTYVCPDMIGGGQYADFKGSKIVDSELFVRSCQASALMPIMQFSYAVWEHLNINEIELCKNAVNLHTKYLNYILELVHAASKTYEPIIRSMAYEYPLSGFEEITDQFMLGNRLIVAPVTEKGSRSRNVVLPNGAWKDIYDNKIYYGGLHSIEAPLEKLPVFEKI